MMQTEKRKQSVTIDLTWQLIVGGNPEQLDAVSSFGDHLLDLVLQAGMMFQAFGKTPVSCYTMPQRKSCEPTMPLTESILWGRLDRPFRAC